MTSWAFSSEMKQLLNERVLRDCPINGQQIVSERMRIRTWKINLGAGGANEFVEVFKGDEYDLGKRKSELQKLVEPTYRLKNFICEESE